MSRLRTYFLCSLLLGLSLSLRAAVATSESETLIELDVKHIKLQELIADINTNFDYRIRLESPHFAETNVSVKVAGVTLREAVAKFLKNMNYTLMRDSQSVYRLYISGESKGPYNNSLQVAENFNYMDEDISSPVTAKAGELYKYEITDDGPDGLSEGIPLPRETAHTGTYQYEINPDGPDGLSESIPIRTE